MQCHLADGKGAHGLAGGGLGHLIEMSSMGGSEDPVICYGVFITFYKALWSNAAATYVQYREYGLCIKCLKD